METLAQDLGQRDSRNGEIDHHASVGETFTELVKNIRFSDSLLSEDDLHGAAPLDRSLQGVEYRPSPGGKIIRRGALLSRFGRIIQYRVMGIHPDLFGHFLFLLISAGRPDISFFQISKPCLSKINTTGHRKGLAAITN